jgi:hypothetical protein
MTETFGYGFMFPNDQLGGFNPVAFIVSQMLARVRTVTLGVVKGVTNTGGVLPAGTVDVQCLVNMVDGRGNATPHGTVFRLPYFRLQSGTSAIIMDPVVGDIGIMLICDRDVSSVEASQAAAPPPSMRMFSFSDGLYLGGILGTQTPTRYISLSGPGISITPEPGMPVVVNGDLHATGSIIAGFGGADQVTVQLHEHTANNTPPTPGT